MLNMDKRITTLELQYIAELFSKYMIEEVGNDPGYQVNDIGKLDSSITQPFQQIANQELYPTLISKASMLYYFCIKNHPFEDGNKRMGIFSLLLYLSKNGYWLNTTNEDLFDITVYTAGSDVKDMDTVCRNIQEFIQKGITKYEVSS